METEESTEVQPVRGRNHLRKRNRVTVISPSPERMRHNTHPHHVKVKEEKNADRGIEKTDAQQVEKEISAPQWKKTGKGRVRPCAGLETQMKQGRKIKLQCKKRGCVFGQTAQKTPVTDNCPDNVEQMDLPSISDRVTAKVMRPSHGQTVQETPPIIIDLTTEDPVPQHNYCEEKSCAKCRVKDLDREIIQLLQRRQMLQTSSMEEINVNRAVNELQRILTQTFKQGQTVQTTTVADNCEPCVQQTNPPDMIERTTPTVTGSSPGQTVQDAPVPGNGRYFMEHTNPPYLVDRITPKGMGPSQRQAAQTTPLTENGRYSMEETDPPNMKDWGWISSKMTRPSQAQTEQETTVREKDLYYREQTYLPNVMDRSTPKVMDSSHGQAVQTTPVTEDGQYLVEQTNPPSMMNRTPEDSLSRDSFFEEGSCVKCRIKDLRMTTTDVVERTQSAQTPPAAENGRSYMEQTNLPDMMGRTTPKAMGPCHRPIPCGSPCTEMARNDMELMNPANTMDTITPKAMEPCGRPFLCGSPWREMEENYMELMNRADKMDRITPKRKGRSRGQTVQGSPVADNGGYSTEQTNLPNIRNKSTPKVTEPSSRELMNPANTMDTSTPKAMEPCGRPFLCGSPWREMEENYMELMNRADKMDRITPKRKGRSRGQTVQGSPMADNGAYSTEQTNPSDVMGRTTAKVMGSSHSRAIQTTPMKDNGRYYVEQTNTSDMMGRTTAKVMGSSHSRAIQTTPMKENGRYYVEETNTSDMMGRTTATVMGSSHPQAVQTTPVTENRQYSMEDRNPPRTLDRSTQDPVSSHTYCEKESYVICRIKDQLTVLIQLLQSRQRVRTTPAGENCQYSTEQMNPPDSMYRTSKKVMGTSHVQTVQKTPVTEDGQNSLKQTNPPNMTTPKGMGSSHGQAVQKTPSTENGRYHMEQTNPPNILDRTTPRGIGPYQAQTLQETPLAENHRYMMEQSISPDMMDRITPQEMGPSHREDSVQKNVPSLERNAFVVGKLCPIGGSEGLQVETDVDREMQESRASLFGQPTQQTLAMNNDRNSMEQLYPPNATKRIPKPEMGPFRREGQDLRDVSAMDTMTYDKAESLPTVQSEAPRMEVDTRREIQEPSACVFGEMAQKTLAMGNDRNCTEQMHGTNAMERLKNTGMGPFRGGGAGQRDSSGLDAMRYGEAQSLPGVGYEALEMDKDLAVEPRHVRGAPEMGGAALCRSPSERKLSCSLCVDRDKNPDSSTKVKSTSCQVQRSVSRIRVKEEGATKVKRGPLWTQRRK